MDKLHMSLDQLSKLNRQKAAPETSNKSGDAGAKGNNNNNSNKKNKKNTDNRKSNDNSNNNARGNNNNRSKGREGAGGAPGGSRGDRGRARNSGGGPRGERNPGGERHAGGPRGDRNANSARGERNPREDTNSRSRDGRGRGGGLAGGNRRQEAGSSSRGGFASYQGSSSASASDRRSGPGGWGNATQQTKRNDRRDGEGDGNPSWKRRRTDDDRSLRSGDTRRGDGRRGGFRGRGGRGGGLGSGRYYDSRPQGPTRRPQAALPPVSEHANEIELSRDDKDTVKIAFRGKPLLDVKKSGLIVVQCPEADRDEDALMVANMALRPLALQLINVSGSQHDKEQWYVTDGRDYKVKCLEQGALGGPESLNATKHLRANVLAELDGENLLFRKWGSNRNVTTVLNAVTKLYKICVQNHWQKPHFHYDRKFVDDKPGFVFSVSLPEFSIEVPKDQRNNWDADMRVAKNKAALKALEIVEKLQPAAAAAPAN